MNMCTNWIIPFIAGVFVGQEIQEAPKVRPYLEAGVKKIMDISREIYENAQANKTSPSSKVAELNVDNEKKTWWSLYNRTKGKED